MPYTPPNPLSVIKNADTTTNFTEVTLTYQYPEGQTFVSRRGATMKFSNEILEINTEDLNRMTYFLPEAIDEPENLLVFINGVYQDPDFYFLSEDKTIIHFNESIPEGYNVAITYTK
jgi:hypothetical protein